jgi:hypothetical protein
LRIVPQTLNIPSLEVDNKCVKYKIATGGGGGNTSSQEKE